LNDSNRIIATLALTTLLKTENEAGIGRLLKRMLSFLNEIGDEFKNLIVDAVYELTQRMPQRANLVVAFLSHAYAIYFYFCPSKSKACLMPFCLFCSVREEGGYSYKEHVVDTLIRISKEVR